MNDSGELADLTLTLMYQVTSGGGVPDSNTSEDNDFTFANFEALARTDQHENLSKARGIKGLNDYDDTTTTFVHGRVD